MPRAGRILLCAVLALTASGCLTRPVEKTVFDQERTTIKLRSHKRMGSVVAKAYEHPFTISAVRAAHILSRLDVRRKQSGEMNASPPSPPSRCI